MAMTSFILFENLFQEVNNGKKSQKIAKFTDFWRFFLEIMHLSNRSQWNHVSNSALYSSVYKSS